MVLTEYSNKLILKYFVSTVGEFPKQLFGILFWFPQIWTISFLRYYSSSKKKNALPSPPPPSLMLPPYQLVRRRITPIYFSWLQLLNLYSMLSPLTNDPNLSDLHHCTVTPTLCSSLIQVRRLFLPQPRPIPLSITTIYSCLCIL